VLEYRLVLPRGPPLFDAFVDGKSRWVYPLHAY